jgi:hypothetical protein
MKSLVCTFLLAFVALAVDSAAEENARQYTMVNSRSGPSNLFVLKLFEGHLDAKKLREATPKIFEDGKTFFAFIRSIPPGSTIYWTTYCDLGEQIMIGREVILKKELIERLKKREIVLFHRTEFL